MWLTKIWRKRREERKGEGEKRADAHPVTGFTEHYWSEPLNKPQQPQRCSDVVIRSEHLLSETLLSERLPEWTHFPSPVESLTDKQIIDGGAGWSDLGLWCHCSLQIWTTSQMKHFQRKEIFQTKQQGCVAVSESVVTLNTQINSLSRGKVLFSFVMSPLICSSHCFASHIYVYFILSFKNVSWRSDLLFLSAVRLHSTTWTSLPRWRLRATKNRWVPVSPSNRWLGLTQRHQPPSAEPVQAEPGWARPAAFPSLLTVEQSQLNPRFQVVKWGLMQLEATST